MQLDLSDLFTTKSEAIDFISRITAISATLFQTNFNFEKALTEHFGVNKRDRFLAIMRENNVNTESLSSVKDFLFILMTTINSLPVLSLSVAFEPQAETLKAVSEWFFINMKKQVLFDISVDRRLVAGAAITYNGKFFDFSIRPTFDRILKNYLTRHDAANPHATVQAKQNMTQTPPTQPIQTPQPVPVPHVVPTAPPQSVAQQPVMTTQTNTVIAQEQH